MLVIGESALRSRRPALAAAIPDKTDIAEDRFVLDPLLGYRWRSNTTFYGEGGIAYRLNNVGLRGPDVASAKPEGTRRILVIGGSTVFGTGATEDQTIPAWLQRLLDPDGSRHVEVINAGVGGYTSTHEVALLRGQLVSLQPDVVVVLDGVNELFHGIQPEWRSFYFELQLRMLHDGRFPDGVAAIDRAVFPSGLLGHYAATAVWQVRRGDRLGWLGIGPEPHGPKDGIAALYAENAGLLAAEATSRGAAALVSLQPMLGYGARRLTPEEHAVEELHSGFYVPQPMWRDALSTLLPQMEREARSKVERAGGHFFDARFALDDLAERAYIEDGFHYTGAANRRLAELLAEEIKRIAPV